MNETGSKRIQIEDDNGSVLKLIDIMDNIFLRLPVKSILMCKAAFNHWRRLIDDPDFIDMHLSMSRKKPIYMIYPCIDENKDVYLMNGNGIITERITLPGCESLSSLRVICSFNGLICCINNASPSSDMIDLNILICNPATQEVLVLPKASSSREECSIGLAFDPTTNEYKVFWFFNAARESHDIRYECEIYSSITGLWKAIGGVAHFPMHSLPTKCSPLSSDHVCINGTAYWFISSEEDPLVPGSILSVDMEETFRTICLPEDVTVTKHSFLFNLEGFLTLVTIDDSEKNVETWIFDEWMEWDPWCHERKDHIPIDDSSQCYYSAAVRENEIFLITSSDYLIYNVVRGMWREVDLDDTLKTKSSAVFTFTESLLPCNGCLHC